MKAMVLDQVGPIEASPLRLMDVACPEPAPGEVRVRVEACGVCHTDLHEVEGELPLPKRPVIPGHQVVGQVAALGDGVNGVRVGQWVGLAWLAGTCGRCEFCRCERENLCAAARFTGYHRDGGYAEYVLAEADYVYALPGGVSAAAAAPLLCAGIIGYRALRLSNIEPGGRLGLYGFGASAHITLQIARHWGCEVYVFSRSGEHRRLAERLGAVWTGPAEEKPPRPLHASVIFAPAGNLAPVALEHLDRGGTCVLAGITMSQIPPLDYEKHLYYEKVLRSVTASTRRDGRELLELAGRIGIRTEVEAYELAQANQALQRLKSGQVNGAAVLRMA